jgi:fumarate reductase (CoM/CoB) subunit A
VKKTNILEADVLVIGTGAAGLRAAIEAGRYGANVLVIDKSLIGVNNNTAFAGGGLKAALPGILDDSMNKAGYKTPEEHIVETVKYGAFLSNQRLVETLAIQAPARLLELQEFGIKNLRLREDITSRHFTKYGSILNKAMVSTCKGLGVRLRPHTVVYDFVAENGKIYGAAAFDCITGKRFTIKTNAIVVATGGAGEVYLRNNSVSQATGEAYSMAFRVGAQLIGMELVQIDPYILSEPGLPLWYVHPCKARFLAVLRNANGEPFLTKYLPLKGKLEDPFPVRYGVLPPDVRELISRAMYLEVLEGRGDMGAVLLDCTKIPEEEWQKDPADRYAREAILRGFDLKNKMIHMLPGAIHNFGGIRINERCETSVQGLYAAGECAGLLHGSGRLGGNALSECIVFGAIAGRNAAEYAASSDGKAEGSELFEQKEALLDRIVEDKENPLPPREAKKTVKTIMWNCAGPVRWEDGLKEGLASLERMQEEDMPRLQALAERPLHIKEAVEAYHMAGVGEMIVRSALMRRESRGGGHYRLDYKEEDNKNWLKNIIVKRVEGRIELDTVPVEITRFRPPQG